MHGKSFPTAKLTCRLLLGISLMASPASAFEAELKLERGAKDLLVELQSASLVLAAKREGATAPQDILAAAQADYGRLISALYERGYYGPVITILIDGREAADVPPLANLGQIKRIELSVTPGPAFRFGAVSVVPITSETELPNGFRKGAPAELSVIRDVAQAGVEGWRAQGYAKAHIVREDVVADHLNAQLDVDLGISQGPRVSFGVLEIEGSKDVRLNRIRKIAAVPTGDVFDPAVLERSAVRLRRTGAFSSVSLREAKTLGSDDTLDIELVVADAKPRRVGFGAELHSSEGLSLSGYWMHRNLMGGAERFRIEGELAGLAGESHGLDYSVKASLTRPSTFEKDTDLTLVAQIDQLDEPLYFLRKASIEAGVSRYFSESLTGELAVLYRYSDVDDSLGTQYYSHLMLRFGATLDRRDDKLNPTNGAYLRAEALPYFGLSGAASGVRGYLDARVYKSVGASDAVVLAGRFQLGTIAGSDIGDTPPDLLFLSGGSGTVRGHSYQSLSVSSGGVETGGRSFLGLSGEARVKINNTFGLTGFYDIGYVGENSVLDETGGWHSGAGVGLRYQTGIGALRFDVAVPVTGVGSNSFEAYVGIGQSF